MTSTVAEARSVVVRRYEDDAVGAVTPPNLHENQSNIFLVNCRKKQIIYTVFQKTGPLVHCLTIFNNCDPISIIFGTDNRQGVPDLLAPA